MEEPNECMLTFYGAVDYGTEPRANGDLVRRRDLIRSIDYVLGDDELVIERLQKLLDHLNG